MVLGCRAMAGWCSSMRAAASADLDRSTDLRELRLARGVGCSMILHTTKSSRSLRAGVFAVSQRLTSAHRHTSFRHTTLAPS